MTNPLAPLRWLNIKLPQAKQTKKKIPSEFPQGFVFVARSELGGGVEVLSVTGVLLPGLASARGASAPCPQLPHHPRRRSAAAEALSLCRAKGSALPAWFLAQRGKMVPLFFSCKGIIWVYLSLVVITPLACPPAASFYLSGGSQAHVDYL